MDITVHKAVFHRNGIQGIGFYAMSFTYEENGKKRTAIATVSGEDVQNVRDKKRHDPQTRILMLDDGERGHVSLTETMRGDHFHRPLTAWLIAHEDTNPTILNKRLTKAPF